MNVESFEFGSKLIETAQELRNAGYSVIPIRTDGSKAPALATWDNYKTELPSVEEVTSWFEHRKVGIAVIGGKVSGNLGIIDIEFADAFAEFSDDVNRHNDKLFGKLPLIQTPDKEESGGRHFYFRAPADFPLATKKLAKMTPEAALARLGDKGATTVIEIKAEGGYVLTEGCPAECHPSKRLYEQKAGPSLAEMEALTPDEVELLLNCARKMNRSVDKAQIVSGVSARPTTGADGGGEERPGDRLNRDGDWREILEPHDWKIDHRKGDAIYWTRPGKDKGVSASTGVCTNERGEELFFVFSTNAEPFEEERAYSKFSAYALLHHGGEWSKAAAALADKFNMGGYTLPAGVILDRDANPPVERLEQARDTEPKFEKSWTHTRKDMATGTKNYEQSLASLAFRLGWNDQQIVNLIIAHRRRWEDGTLDEMLNSAYLARVLARAKKPRGVGGDVEKKAIAEAEAAEAVAAGEAAGRDGRLDELNSLFGIQIERVLRRGRAQPRYAIKIKGGGEIDLGSDLNNITMIRKSALDTVLTMPTRMHGYEWDPYATMLAQLAESVELHEGEPEQQLLSQISRYLDEKLEGDESTWFDAYLKRAPFYREGKFFVNTTNFQEWLAMHRDKYKIAELTRLLTQMEFEQDPDPKRPPGGGAAVHRHYWCRKIEGREPPQMPPPRLLPPQRQLRHPGLPATALPSASAPAWGEQHRPPAQSPPAPATAPAGPTRNTAPSAARRGPAPEPDPLRAPPGRASARPRSCRRAPCRALPPTRPASRSPPPSAVDAWPRPPPPDQSPAPVHSGEPRC